MINWKPAIAAVTIILWLSIPNRVNADPWPLVPDDCATARSFGRSVAASGTTAIIGAPSSSTTGSLMGGAYWFELGESGWEQRQFLLPADAGSFEQVGWGVAILGNIAVLAGRFGHSTPTATRLAVVYRFDGSTWIEEQSLWGAPNLNTVSISNRLAITEVDGSVMAFVGTSREDQDVSNSGVVRVFRNKGAAWESLGLLAHTDLEGPGQRFGFSLAASGSVAVVGAPTFGSLTRNSSAVFVYRWNPGTSQWLLEQRLDTPNTSYFDNFGLAVAIHDDLILVGGPNDNTHSTSTPIYRSGSAFGFRRTSTEWYLEQEFSAPSPVVEDQFGSSVALTAGHAFIGAPGRDDIGTNTGALYAFRNCAGRWLLDDILTAPEGTVRDGLGTCVAATQQFVVAGVPFTDAVCEREAISDRGVAYVFSISDFDCNRNGIHDEVEIASELAPDCNGNCLPDDCEVPPLCPHCLDCNRNHVPDTCDLTLGTSQDCDESNVPDECEMPPLCAECMDCNANGVPDSCDALGGPGLDCNRNAIPDECEAGPTCTRCLDCNDNGVPDECDMASGASEDCTRNGIPDECELDCDESGVADVCENQALLLGLDPVPRFNFSRAVAVNDEFAFVGAPSDRRAPAVVGPGAVYVFRRDGIAWAPMDRLEANDPVGHLGLFGSALGLNCNYFANVCYLAVGAPGDDENSIDAGAVYVFRGNGFSWKQLEKITAPDPRSEDNFGAAVTFSGTMLIVGAPGNADSSSSQTRVGKVYVYQPTQAGWVYQEQLVPWLWRVPQQFGSSLATSSNHLLVGAPFCGERGSRSGAVYAFEFNGRDWLPRQFLLPDEDSQDSFFGSAVAVNDNRALVGATGTGLHTFFHFERGLWLEHQRMLISRGVPSLSDSQTSIALQSGLAVVGDFRENADGFQSGAAYLLRLRGQTWSSERKLVPANLAAYDRFGYSVAMDDRRNLIIGAPNNTGGAAHLYPLADLRTGDSDLDGVLTVSDGAAFLSCTSGPQATDESNLPFGCLATFDFDGDADIDLADLAAFQRGFGCSE